MNNLYFSVSAFGGTTIENSLFQISEAGIRNIEISVGCKVNENSPALLQEYIKNGYKLLPHHAAGPIIGHAVRINLCGPFQEEYFRTILGFCVRAGCKHYSVHPGMYNPNVTDINTAYFAFYKNLLKLYKLGKEYGIAIAVETAYPSMTGDKYLLDNEDAIRTFRETYPFIGVVLDFAHVNIQIHSDQSGDSIIKMLLNDPMLMEVHISENDGKHDIHTPITTKAWFWKWAHKFPDNIPIVIEGKLQASRQIKENYKMVADMLTERKMASV